MVLSIGRETLRPSFCQSTSLTVLPHREPAQSFRSTESGRWARLDTELKVSNVRVYRGSYSVSYQNRIDNRKVRLSFHIFPPLKNTQSSAAGHAGQAGHPRLTRFPKSTTVEDNNLSNTHTCPLAGYSKYREKVRPPSLGCLP